MLQYMYLYDNGNHENHSNDNKQTRALIDFYVVIQCLVTSVESVE